MREIGVTFEPPFEPRRQRSAPGPWFGLIFVVAGLAVLVFGIFALRDNARLDEEGVTVTGRIADLTVSTDSEGSRSYHVRYEFADPATRATLEDSESVSRAFFDRSQVGDPITITFLPAEPKVSRIGAPPFTGNLGPFVLMGFGAVFAAVGAGVTVSLRGQQRRRAAAAAMGAPDVGGFDVSGAVAGPAIEPENRAERARVDAFTRGIGRVLLDGLMAPVGGIAFLGFSVFLFGQASSDPMLLVVALLPAFFGLLLLSGIPVVVRRGLRREVLCVGPTGLWHVDVGLLPWPEIAEVRIEHNIGPAGDAGLTTYGRLGIVPRDPEIARRAPGRLALGLAGAFLGLTNRLAEARGYPTRMTNVADMAPLGAYAYELQQPFPELIVSIRRFAPVVDAAAAQAAAAPAPSATPEPAVERTEHPVTAVELRELDALLGGEGAGGAGFDGDRRVDGGFQPRLR